MQKIRELIIGAISIQVAHIYFNNCIFVIVLCMEYIMARMEHIYNMLLPQCGDTGQSK